MSHIDVNAAWQFGRLKMFGYDFMDIDPPTRFELRNEETGGDKSAASQYSLMTWDDLARLRIGDLMRGNGIIALWACAPTLKKSFELLDHWNVKYLTQQVWRKTTKNGKVRVGPGYRGRTMHEPILIGTVSPRFQDHKAVPSLFDGWDGLPDDVPDIFDGLAREHSRKPDEFYSIWEKAYPHAWKARLFARADRDGWDSEGNEVTKFNEETAS